MFIWTGYTIISRYPTTTERGPNYKSLTDSVTILSQGLEFYSTRSIFLHILPSHRHLMLQRFFGTIFILLKSCWLNYNKDILYQNVIACLLKWDRTEKSNCRILLLGNIKSSNLMHLMVSIKITHIQILCSWAWQIYNLYISYKGIKNNCIFYVTSNQFGLNVITVHIWYLTKWKSNRVFLLS